MKRLAARRVSAGASVIAVVALVAGITTHGATANPTRERDAAIAYAVASGNTARTALYILPFNATRARQLTPGAGPAQLGWPLFTWSPDGSSLAYACNSGGGESSGHDAICIIGLNGHVRHLTKGGYPIIIPVAWSPDGRLIASECGYGGAAAPHSDNESDQLCFVNATTGSVEFETRLSAPRSSSGYLYSEDIWSPDGSMLATICSKVASNEKVPEGLCLVGKDRRLRLLTTGPDEATLEGWTGDSKQIIWRKHAHPFLAETTTGHNLHTIQLSRLDVRGPSYSARGDERLETLNQGSTLAVVTRDGRPQIVTTVKGEQIWAPAWQPSR